MNAQFYKDLKRFSNTLKKAAQKEDHSYDIQAKVIRTENDIAWVSVPGGVDETPVDMPFAVKRGDTVRVRFSNNKAWIAGNTTAPPTDDTKANVANDNANIAQGTATTAKKTATVAKETAEAILVYDHDYVLETVDGRLIAEFHAHLYQGGVDIHTSFHPERFTWYMKTEDKETYLGSGYTITVDTTNCGYGAEIIGKFTDTGDAEALNNTNDNLTNVNNKNYTVRASGDSVRVRDLSVTTSLYPTDKLMVIGAEDEHLVAFDTIKDAIGDLIEKPQIEGVTLEGNKTYEELNLQRVTNSEMEAMFQL